jgi:hypothetical protein
LQFGEGAANSERNGFATGATITDTSVAGAPDSLRTMWPLPESTYPSPFESTFGLQVGWYWHVVAPALSHRGHEAVPVALPAADDAAGLAEYASTALRAIGDSDPRRVVIVAQSLAGFVAPLVCEQRQVRGRRGDRLGTRLAPMTHQHSVMLEVS